MIGIDALGFADQIIHHMARNLGAVIVEQAGDDVFLAGLDQSLGHVLAQTLAHRNGELMLHRAVLDGLNEVGVLQHVALEQDGMGDLELVIGELDD